MMALNRQRSPCVESQTSLKVSASLDSIHIPGVIYIYIYIYYITRYPPLGPASAYLIYTWYIHIYIYSKQQRRRRVCQIVLHVYAFAHACWQASAAIQQKRTEYTRKNCTVAALKGRRRPSCQTSLPCGWCLLVVQPFLLEHVLCT